MFRPGLLKLHHHLLHILWVYCWMVSSSTRVKMFLCFVSLLNAVFPYLWLATLLHNKIMISDVCSYLVSGDFSYNLTWSHTTDLAQDFFTVVFNSLWNSALLSNTHDCKDLYLGSNIYHPHPTISQASSFIANNREKRFSLRLVFLLTFILNIYT